MLPVWLTSLFFLGPGSLTTPLYSIFPSLLAGSTQASGYQAFPGRKPAYGWWNSLLCGPERAYSHMATTYLWHCHKGPTVPEIQLLQWAAEQVYSHFEPEKSTIIITNRGRESHPPRLGPSRCLWGNSLRPPDEETVPWDTGAWHLPEDGTAA